MPQTTRDTLISQENVTTGQVAIHSFGKLWKQVTLLCLIGVHWKKKKKNTFLFILSLKIIFSEYNFKVKTGSYFFSMGYDSAFFICWLILA